MGKEQEGSLGNHQEEVLRGASGQPLTPNPLEQAIAPVVPRVEPIEIFPGQPPQQDQVPAFRKTAKMQAVEAAHGAGGESIVAILKRLYHTEGKTQAEVAQVLEIGHATVVEWMARTGVESRPRGGSRKGRRVENRVGHKERQVADVVESLSDFLHTQCEEKGASIAAIAKEIERKSNGRVTVSLKTVKSWLQKFGIRPIRAKSRGPLGQHRSEETKRKMREAHKKRWQMNRERLLVKIQSKEARAKRKAAQKGFYASEKGQRVKKAAVAKAIETKKRKAKEKELAKLQETLGGNPTEILRRMHWGQGLTVEEIGERIGRNVAETEKLMRYAGVSIRKEEKAGKRSHGTVKKEDREVFEQAFHAGLTSKLPEKWRYILADRYLTKKPTTLQEIGRKHRRTGERVRQIEKKALKALRRMLAGEEI